MQIIILLIAPIIPSYCLAFTSVGVGRSKPSRERHHVLFLSIESHQPSIASSSATLHRRLNRSEAREITDNVLCPPSEERDRDSAGMQAFDTASDEYRGNVIENNDPRTQYAYGEFPFDSFDLLVDRALELANENTQADNHLNESYKRKKMVDLGSGCGRLVLYAALTRGNQYGSDDDNTLWDFHGVEIGSKLHNLAINSLKRGVDNELFSTITIDKDVTSKIMFHNGNALLVEDPYFTTQSTEDINKDDSVALNHSIQSLLSETKLLFAYSTVWETDPTLPFDPDMGAMILSPKWSQTLALLCPNKCVAVTTDRALNPRDGWRLLDRMDVENPSVWGSVGYISILEKSS